MFEDAKIRHAEQYGPEAAEAVYGDLEIAIYGWSKGRIPAEFSSQ